MDRSCTVSEINGDFSRKSLKKIPPLCILRPAEGVPLELGIGVQNEKKLKVLPGR